MYLSNKIIYLKKLTLKYVSSFKSLFNDPEMCRYLSIPYPLNDKWIKDYIGDSMEMYNQEEKYTWGIFRHSLDDLVGVAVIKDIDSKNRVARIGYSTGKKFWNNSYTIMTVRLILDYAFRKLNLNRIEVRIETDDQRSMKLLNEIGAIQEGLMRQAVYYNDTFKDLYLYSILKNDYYNKLEEKMKR
ncbi:MAG: hypothetical protein A2015_10880 [Spirochaetes bacterium GWF1_31_7]|nr:MAG: hypothetical protein A2Y30_13015 [Spirochaetes bacterium GWE1_32_154]OHD48362.1 MAG: hypothetical protein A2015_10880 [Spirochaetes bacterium GWF1_31_7]OHD50455.1 MAG: hypothetical protein A2Y29_11060 [Spirochaetes bacterium GWE2_31_10]OHD81593.1 MAG: hypothetical protein A2355_17750 [Spirochaetes bacterium RIFOXYB1_FULL_32_8]HBD96365.1 hypothetical protein [Spirochaetia bacterium]